MDALAKAALDKVNDQVQNINNNVSGSDKERLIARAINAVDALKSALKALY